MRRALGPALFVLLALALAGCGSSSSSGNEWDASVKAGPNGSLDVEKFNDFLARGGDIFASSPIAAVTEFLRLDTVSAATTSIQSTTPGETRDQSAVVVILDGLLDDSIRAARYDIGLQRDPSQMWRLTSARLTVRCQAGRGHANFSAKRCI